MTYTLSGGPVLALFFIGVGFAILLGGAGFYVVMRGVEIGRRMGLW